MGKGGKKGGSVQHKASFFFFFYILCLSEQLVWTLVASAGKNFPLFFPKFYFDGHAFTTLLLRSDCVTGCFGRPFFNFHILIKLSKFVRYKIEKGFSCTTTKLEHISCRLKEWTKEYYYRGSSISTCQGNICLFDTRIWDTSNLPHPPSCSCTTLDLFHANPFKLQH